MSRYSKLPDGGEVTIKQGEEILRTICCDCGAVHYNPMVIKKKTITMAFFKDRRATAQFRRNTWGNLHKGIRGWKLIHL